MDLPPWAGLLLALGAVIGVFSVVVSRNWERHWRKLAAERPCEDFASFARSDWGQPIPPRVLREVYNWSQSLATAGFPVRPEDDLCRDFGCCGDDVGWGIEDLAER
jgi:hypothetical protein